MSTFLVLLGGGGVSTLLVLWGMGMSMSLALGDGGACPRCCWCCGDGPWPPNMMVTAACGKERLSSITQRLWLLLGGAFSVGHKKVKPMAGKAPPV